MWLNFDFSCDRDVKTTTCKLVRISKCIEENVTSSHLIQHPLVQNGGIRKKSSCGGSIQDHSSQWYEEIAMVKSMRWISKKWHSSMDSITLFRLYRMFIDQMSQSLNSTKWSQWECFRCIYIQEACQDSNGNWHEKTVHLIDILVLTPIMNFCDSQMGIK